MKKRIIAALLAAMLVVAAGCGNQKKGEAVQAGSSKDTEAVSSGSNLQNAFEQDEDTTPVVDQDLTLEESIRLGDYKGLKLTKTVYEISDETVSQYASSKKQPIEVTDANAKAEDGDTVNIAFEGKIDGKTFEGGSSTSYDLTLGSNSMIDGFEKGIVGMKKGESKDLNLTFPKDYFSKDLAGKAVVFKVTLNTISRNEKPSKEELKSAREELKGNYDNQSKQQLLASAWSEGKKKAEFLKLSKADIDAEEKRMDDQVNSIVESSSMSFDDFLKAQGMTKENYEKFRLNRAKETVKDVLFLKALAAAEKVDKNSDEYQKALKGMLDNYGVTEEELAKEAGEEMLYNYVMTQVLSERLVSYADIKEVKEEAK